MSGPVPLRNADMNPQHHDHGNGYCPLFDPVEVTRLGIFNNFSTWNLEEGQNCRAHFSWTFETSSQLTSSGSLDKNKASMQGPEAERL